MQQDRGLYAITTAFIAVCGLLSVFAVLHAAHSVWTGVFASPPIFTVAVLASFGVWLIPRTWPMLPRIALLLVAMGLVVVLYTPIVLMACACPVQQ